MKVFFAMFLLLASAYAQEPMAEYCAVFIGENSYELHLTKDIEIPCDSSWKIPDSLSANVLKWSYSYFLEAPEIYEKRCACCDDSGENCLCFRLRGGGDGVYSCVHCETFMRKVPPLSRYVGMEHDPLHSMRFEMIHAKDSLPGFYGKAFDGNWSASLSSSNIQLSAKFRAKIVGECEGPFTVAEYCLSSKGELLRVNVLDYITPVSFFDKAVESCEGGFESVKNLAVDFEEFGMFTMGPYVEWQKGKGVFLADSVVKVAIPQSLPVGKFLGDKEKLENRTFLAKWDAALTCNSRKIEREVKFKIRVAEKCPESSEKVVRGGFPRGFEGLCQIHRERGEWCKIDTTKINR